MEIIVLGAGAIGSLYGAKLAATNDVTLVGRAEHVAAINANGLRVEGLESEIVRVPALTALVKIGPNALRPLTTKRPDVAAALEPIARLGRDDRRLANPPIDPLKELVIAECIAVAASQGVVLEENFQEEMSDFFRPSHNIASMLQDLGRGHTTEIDYLNGAVATLGARQGVDCPVNAALTAIIKAMEAASLFPKKMLEPEPA